MKVQQSSILLGVLAILTLYASHVQGQLPIPIPGDPLSFIAGSVIGTVKTLILTSIFPNPLTAILGPRRPRRPFRGKRSSEGDLLAASIALEESVKELESNDPAQCYRRLLCEMGANPSLLTDFLQSAILEGTEGVFDIKKYGQRTTDLLRGFRTAYELGVISGSVDECRATFDCPTSGQKFQATLLNTY